ncbi:MAG: 3-isopropylmalate dehydratase large subunit [Methanocellales archaeon]
MGKAKAKTMAEKILSRKTGREVSPGDLVVSEVDLAFAHDGTMPLAIQQMESGLKTRRVFNSRKVIGICDHASPSPSEKISNVHIMMRKFARENGIAFFENGDGICHQIVIEKYAAPYKVIAGADSHSCTHGAVGAFATGVGSTDIAAIFVYGKTWFRVPESLKINIKGRLPRYVYSKDVFLKIVSIIGAEGAAYKSMEFLGETVDRMEVEERLVLSNMSVEAGAKLGLCKADEKVRAFLKQYGRVREYQALEPDENAVYEDEIEISVDKLQPLVACPHRVDNVKTARELSSVELDQICIGSCTNGRLSDLRIAARILKGKRVNSNTRLVVYPASRGILFRAMQDGIIQILVKAGASIGVPGCGFCIGRTVALGDGEKVLSTQNRNFKGRMGNDKAEIYLCSPATAAVSAVTGRITDPRDYFGVR